ncbi:MAG: tRNA (adenosine(37)-N6)-dimethylallyltransferase MiaA [Chloroflexi bacterium]|nr:tRNA (adenosine(37)-N6)-dimethylallyltransferase MiaA [Chloroflexota bacterium]
MDDGLLLVIVGPTAVGKSGLALDVAQRMDGEIVSADSRQVYRYMDIGTDKPSLQERAVVPHNLIDIVDPDQDFSVAVYQRMAYQAVEDIRGRGRLPILVGGSGLYVSAVVNGLSIPLAPPNPELRRELEARAKKEGTQKLYADLLERDPVAAGRIDPANLRRIVRALEVCLTLGRPFSQLQQRQPPPYAILMLGLTTDRGELYRRIDARVERQMERGLVEEVKGLVARGYDFSLPSMSALGYKQIGMYLRGEIDVDTAVDLIKTGTHRLARQQYAWFSLRSKDIRWLDISQEIKPAIYRQVQAFREHGGNERLDGDVSTI